MKKIMNWVLAVTLVCGPSVFTSCSSNEDSPSPAEQSKKDRKEFVAHTRQTLKYMAENMNFGTWEAANSLNQNFNEYVLNNPNFQKAIIPLFLQKIQESTKPVEEGSELAEMGYTMYSTMDLTDFNYRFTMNDENTGFIIEPAEDFEMILNSYNPETKQIEKGTFKLTLKSGGQSYGMLVSRMSTKDVAVVALVPEDFAYAISYKLMDSWMDAFTGTFKNLTKNSEPSKIINQQNDGYTISGTLTSNIPAIAQTGKAADATTINFLIDGIQVVEQASQVRVPVLSHCRDVASEFGAHLLQEFFVKLEADVLDGIKAESVNSGLTDVPQKPLADFFFDDRIAHVDIHSHQIVKIALLRVSVLLPGLACKAIDQALIFRQVVIICPGKMCVVPGKSAVFALSAGECKFGPDTHDMGIVDLFVAILFQIRDSHHILRFIRPHPVVEDDICEDADVVVVESPDSLEVFFAGAVFGADSALLVKFAQVIHVIDAIADVFL